MSCLRCDGFLVSDYWPGLNVKLVRCLNCGDITDEVILTNRSHNKPPAWIVAEVLCADLRGQIKI